MTSEQQPDSANTTTNATAQSESVDLIDDTTTASDGGTADHSATATTSPNESQEAEQPRFLVGLDYEERAERRRVEYRLESWDGTVDKLPRMSRIVTGENFYELYDSLKNTVDDPAHLSVYELDDLTPSRTERTVRIDRVFDVELDRLQWATQSLLDKRIVSELDSTTYEIHPDSGDGSVTLEYNLMEVQEGTRLELTFTGPTPAPNAMKDSMERDLGYLLPEPLEVFDA